MATQNPSIERAARILATMPADLRQQVLTGLVNKYTGGGTTPATQDNATGASTGGTINIQQDGTTASVNAPSLPQAYLDAGGAGGTTARASIFESTPAPTGSWLTRLTVGEGAKTKTGQEITETPFLPQAVEAYRRPFEPLAGEKLAQDMAGPLVQAALSPGPDINPMHWTAILGPLAGAFMGTMAAKDSGFGGPYATSMGLGQGAAMGAGELQQYNAGVQSVLQADANRRKAAADILQKIGYLQQSEAAKRNVEAQMRKGEAEAWLQTKQKRTAGQEQTTRRELTLEDSERLGVEKQRIALGYGQLKKDYYKLSLQRNVTLNDTYNEIRAAKTPEESQKDWQNFKELDNRLKGIGIGLAQLTGQKVYEPNFTDKVNDSYYDAFKTDSGKELGVVRVPSFYTDRGEKEYEAGGVFDYAAAPEEAQALTDLYTKYRGNIPESEIKKLADNMKETDPYFSTTVQAYLKNKDKEGLAVYLKTVHKAGQTSAVAPTQSGEQTK